MRNKACLLAFLIGLMTFNEFVDMWLRENLLTSRRGGLTIVNIAARLRSDAKKAGVPVEEPHPFFTEDMIMRALAKWI